MTLITNYLEQLEQYQLSDLVEFVVNENFKHHDQGKMPQNHASILDAIYEEEERFFKNSQIFVAKDYLGSISGSIRTLRWNYKDLLPIHKIFDIDPLSIHPLGEKRPSIWHIGRFAIRKEIRNISLLKKLMLFAIAPICKDKNSIAFAECDSKLLKVLNLLGIKTNTIGDSVDYLGSETIPISMSYDGLIDFYRENSSLMYSPQA